MAESEYVVLKGGLSVPVEPMLLMLELERKGFTLSRDGEDIFVRPFSKLTAEDREQLRRWKTTVLALLDYHAPEVQ